MQFSVLEESIFVLDCDGEIVERLMVILAHHIEFNANVHFPVSRHEIIFEFSEKCFEWEGLEFIIVNLNPVFPAGIFQSGHHLCSLLLLHNILVCDIVPACDLKFPEYFSIEISRIKDRTFPSFLFTNGDSFL